MYRPMAIPFATLKQRCADIGAKALHPIKPILGLLQLAKQLSRVSQARKAMGPSLAPLVRFG